MGNEPDIGKTIAMAGELNKITKRGLERVRLALDVIKAKQGIRRVKFAQEHGLDSTKSKVLRRKLMRK